MLRMYDAVSDEENIESLLNDEGYHIIKISNYISDSGYAGSNIDYRTPRNNYEKERRRERQHIKVFAIEGSRSEALDLLLEEEDVRVIERIEKMTEIGPLVLLHYEKKPTPDWR